MKEEEESMLLFTGKSKMGSSQLVAVAVYGGMFKVQFFHLKDL